MAKKRAKLKRRIYEDKLAELHFELVKMQYWIKETGQTAEEFKTWLDQQIAEQSAPDPFR